MTSIFVLVEENLFECKLCSKIIKRSGNGNYNLKKHYEGVHAVGNEVNCPICKLFIINYHT